MSYQVKVTDLAEDPEQLEQVYQEALAAGEAEGFEKAINAGHADAPDNLLYAAWFYRLKQTGTLVKENFVAWGWVIPLALLNGLIFWLLSDDRFMITIESFQGVDRVLLPAIMILAGPISAVVLLVYLTAAGKRKWTLSVIIAACLLAAGAYVLLFYRETGIRFFQEQYLNLMALHLPLLAWAGVGFFLIARHRDPANRFAFLIKSLEVIILGGLFAIAGGLFTGISFGLFETLDVDLPDAVMRLFVAGGLGLIVVLATAVIYNPAEPPRGQAFDEGLSKLVALLMRVLLPFTLLVLLVYLVFIPFNFRAPFENRDVLIIYNAMLFAVVALLVGATPVSLEGISPRLAPWLRRAIIAVAALALLVSLYALAAIIYRTALDRLTPNRLTFIGWNVINIGLLLLLLVYQFRAKEGRWLPELHRAFSAGTVAYAAWALVVILALPWLYGVDQGAIEDLPNTVQRAIYEQPAPLLMKCASSPHIYLIEGGRKRWIDTIETFSDRGYAWSDVYFVPCADLRKVPDGPTIPEGVGPPPQP